MRTLTPTMLEALTGSVTDIKMVCHAWYENELVEKNLPVSKWAMAWDGKDTALVQGKASFTITDDTGRLAPWGWDEPLSAAGSKIQTAFMVKDEAVDIGWWPIIENRPNELWRVSGQYMQWVSGGASIPLEAEELTRLAADFRFWSPESPPAGATVISEVRRLMDGICPVIIGAGVVDRAVPKSMIYKDNHAAHVLDLVRSIDCWYRMTGDGQLEIYSQAKTAPVWTIQGRNGGALVSVNRKQSRSDILNGVASTSNDPNLEIRQLATIDKGPLRYGGPAGWLIQEHTALADTAAGVLQDATTTLRNKTNAKTLLLETLCTPHPGVQIGDWVRVAHPIIDGSEYPLDGIVTHLELNGGTEGMSEMKLGVEVSVADAAAIGFHVRRLRRWA